MMSNTTALYNPTLQRQRKTRREFLLASLLLAPLALGVFLVQAPNLHSSGKPMNTTVLSQQLLQGTMAAPRANGGKPTRAVPGRFKILGTVNDQYTVAKDPESGDMLINDSMGSIGTNNTSIEGDRAILAEEMVDLEQYAEEHRDTLKPEDYRWLKKVALVGTQLAFGLPGLPLEQQPALKQDLLADFHNVSSNPTQSILQTDEYLSLEQVFQKPEAAYQNPEEQLATNYLLPDPLSPSLNQWLPDGSSLLSLDGKLANTLLYPSMDALANPYSSYNYWQPNTTTAYANTLQPTSSTGSTSTTGGSLNTTTGSTSTNTLTSSSTSYSGVTVADYYNTTLGTSTSGSTLNTSTLNNTVLSPTATTTQNAIQTVTDPYATTNYSLTNTTTSSASVSGSNYTTSSSTSSQTTSSQSGLLVPVLPLVGIRIVIAP